ncbi:MAG: hypothetical protein JSU07_07860, partial [Bacteroidetes bacterium]|nr:hypothetical protein [Bacteroidota bacterium]
QTKVFVAVTVLDAGVPLHEGNVITEISSNDKYQGAELPMHFTAM